MSDKVSMQISIPSDNEGFILLQCSYCGELFKITVFDLNDDSVLNIWCPCCGLISDSYFTQEVIELVQAKLRNFAMDMVYDSFKKLERKNTSKSPVKIKVGNKPKREHENLIHSRIDELIIKHYACCNRCAKINPLKRMSASFCPFCGVICFEDEQN